MDPTLLPMTMAAHNSQGIQTLLEAEKDAATIVQGARQYRIEKQRMAKEEATKEIAEYTKQVEASLSAFKQSHAGNTNNVGSAINVDTEAKLEEITDIFQRHKDQVLDALRHRVMLVEPELHRNLKMAAVKKGLEEQ